MAQRFSVGAGAGEEIAFDATAKAEEEPKENGNPLLLEEDQPNLENLLVGLPENLYRKILCEDGYCTTKEICRFVRETEEERAKTILIQDDVIWKHFLKKEDLPGESYDDLEKQMMRWDMYQKALKMKLYEIVANDGSESVNPTVTPEKCQEFLCDAIFAFTKRVATAHSWYKHLPVAEGIAKFYFSLDLSSNRRMKDGRWIDFVDGDGTRIHYSWLPTASFRKRYGCFDYSRAEEWGSTVRWNNPENGKAEQVVTVPKSFRPSPASVTAVVHGSKVLFRGRKLSYMHHLEAEISQGPSLLAETNLPKEAIRNLQMIAQALADPSSDLSSLRNALLGTFHTHVPGDDLADLFSEVPSRDDLSRWADFAIDLQRIRERFQMAKSLRRLCLLVYGDELTPSPQRMSAALKKSRYQIAKSWDYL